MKLSAKQYAQAFYQAISDTNPKDYDTVLDRFVNILAQNGDLNKFEEIQKEYQTLELSEKGIKQADVTLARKTELNSHIVIELNRVVSGKLELKTKVDEKLIGGVVVRVDDTLIDASIKTQLNNLNEQLKK